MIDDPDIVARLLDDLNAVLPVKARLTEDTRRRLQKSAGWPALSPECVIERVEYGGDVGGIICFLQKTDPADKDVFMTSITHLRFDVRHPLARSIETYQRRRRKRLVRFGHLVSIITKPSVEVFSLR